MLRQLRESTSNSDSQFLYVLTITPFSGVLHGQMEEPYPNILFSRWDYFLQKGSIFRKLGERELGKMSRNLARALFSDSLRMRAVRQEAPWGYRSQSLTNKRQTDWETCH